MLCVVKSSDFQPREAHASKYMSTSVILDILDTNSCLDHISNTLGIAASWPPRINVTCCKRMVEGFLHKEVVMFHILKCLLVALKCRTPSDRARCAERSGGGRCSPRNYISAGVYHYSKSTSARSLYDMGRGQRW